MSNYYVYFHINPITNTIFYIGKGKGKRAFTKNNRNKHWYNTVNKYRGFIVDIIESNLTEEEAFQIEKKYISKIGLNNLTNMTLGGEGASGRKHIVSEETRKKLSEVSIGRKHSEETKKKMSKNNKGENNPMYGKPSTNRKKVLNTETGIYYDSVIEASKSVDIKYTTLVGYLNGNIGKNKTNLKYI